MRTTAVAVLAILVCLPRSCLSDVQKEPELLGSAVVSEIRGDWRINNEIQAEIRRRFLAQAYLVLAIRFFRGEMNTGSKDLAYVEEAYRRSADPICGLDLGSLEGSREVSDSLYYWPLKRAVSHRRQLKGLGLRVLGLIDLNRKISRGQISKEGIEAALYTKGEALLRRDSELKRLFRVTQTAHSQHQSSSETELDLVRSSMRSLTRRSSWMQSEVNLEELISRTGLEPISNPEGWMKLVRVLSRSSTLQGTFIDGVYGVVEEIRKRESERHPRRCFGSLSRLQK